MREWKRVGTVQNCFWSNRVSGKCPIPVTVMWLLNCTCLYYHTYSERVNKLQQSVTLQLVTTNTTSQVRFIHSPARCVYVRTVCLIEISPPTKWHRKWSNKAKKPTCYVSILVLHFPVKFQVSMVSFRNLRIAKATDHCNRPTPIPKASIYV